MDRERDFLDELDVDLGQRRSRDTLALYLKGLRVCEGRRSLANIAAAVADPVAKPTKLIERFNYQLNDRQGRNGRGLWAQAMMRALAERTANRLSATRPQVFVLATMFAPHLGRSVLAQSDVNAGTAQVVASLLLVGFGPTGELEGQPIGWRLVFDAGNWDEAAFQRSEVPPTVRHIDHVSVPAGAMLTEVARWSIPQVPIVAGKPFDDLRFHWLAAGRSYVVASQEPHGAALEAIPPTDASPVETLRNDIEQPDDNWRNVLRERAPESTSRALTARRTDLMTKWRTVESAIEIGESVWRAHLPDVPDGERVNQALDYDALRQSVIPIYRETLPELGLNDYRGRYFAGWHAHRALVSAAHLMNREETWDAAEIRAA